MYSLLHLLVTSVLILQTCTSEPVRLPTLVISSPGEPDNMNVIVKGVHDTLTLWCEVRGEPLPRRYDWTFVGDNKTLGEDRPFKIVPAVGTGGSMLQKSDLHVSDSGKYTCSAPPFSDTKYILVTTGIIVDMKNPAMSDDQHALDGCGFIHSTLYYTSAAACALLFMAAVVLLVFTIRKMRTRRTTREHHSNLQYHQLPSITMDVKMPSVHSTGILQTDTVPGPPDSPRLNLKLCRYQLSMPRFGRSDARTHTSNTPNVAEKKPLDLNFIGSVRPPSYTETVNFCFPGNLSSKGLITASQDRNRKETDSHYKMAPTNVRDTNVYNGTNDVAHGDGNVFNGNDSVIYGNRNVINGSSCQVTGSDNVITGNNCQVYGDHNVINGDCNILHGNHVVINGHNDNIHANNRVINGNNIVNSDLDNDMLNTASAVLARDEVYGNNDQAVRDNIINNDNVNNAVGNVVVSNDNRVDIENEDICNENKVIDDSNNLRDTNVYNGINDVAHGENNVFNGNDSTIYGDRNVINGDNNILHGNDVVINGHNNNIHANNRVINGNNIVN